MCAIIKIVYRLKGRREAFQKENEMKQAELYQAPRAELLLLSPQDDILTSSPEIGSDPDEDQGAWDPASTVTRILVSSDESESEK